MAEKIPVIHRDGTFEYKGVQYRVTQGSDRPEKTGDRYVERLPDMQVMADGFGYMREIREWLQVAVEKDYPDLDELRLHEHQEYSGPAGHVSYGTTYG